MFERCCVGHGTILIGFPFDDQGAFHIQTIYSMIYRLWIYKTKTNASCCCCCCCCRCCFGSSSGWLSETVNHLSSRREKKYLQSGGRGGGGDVSGLNDVSILYVVASKTLRKTKQQPFLRATNTKTVSRGIVSIPVNDSFYPDQQHRHVVVVWLFSCVAVCLFSREISFSTWHSSSRVCKNSKNKNHFYIYPFFIFNVMAGRARDDRRTYDDCKYSSEWLWTLATEL